MRRFARFLRLPVREQLALARAAAMVSSVRAALAVLPFRRVLAAADRLASSGSPRAGDPAERERIMQAVETVARHLLPAGPCLSQAIVADMLLRRRGFPSNLHIGVARGPGGEMRAHAWVESDGEVVIGGAESPSDFTALPDPRRLS